MVGFEPTIHCFDNPNHRLERNWYTLILKAHGQFDSRISPGRTDIGTIT
jgi:hypothetical protein